MRKHWNVDHGKKRMADEDMFLPVKLQCWFGEKRGRFWIVDPEKPKEKSDKSDKSVEPEHRTSGRKMMIHIIAVPIRARMVVRTISTTRLFRTLSSGRQMQRSDG